MQEHRKAERALWRERLETPTYRVGEAARYARTATQTVVRWQHLGADRVGALGPRDAGAPLSYLQLIELGVVAAMRQAGVSLRNIRAARAYMGREFGTRHPFAIYRFKSDGKGLFVDYDQIEGGSSKDKLLTASLNGQLAWGEVVGRRLREFDYDPASDIVLAWRVDGPDSPVRVDPRLAFGAPSVRGIATWVLRERWISGENALDIADDFDLAPSEVEAALTFEGVVFDPERPGRWVN